MRPAPYPQGHGVFLFTVSLKFIYKKNIDGLKGEIRGSGVLLRHHFFSKKIQRQDFEHTLLPSASSDRQIEPFFPYFNHLQVSKRRKQGFFFNFSISVSFAEPRKDTGAGMPWPWEYERKDYASRIPFSILFVQFLVLIVLEKKSVLPVFSALKKKGAWESNRSH